MAEKARKKGKKNRKVGRNALSCKIYRLSQRREHNKIRRLNKHLKRFVNDGCAQNALKLAKAALRGG